MHLCIALAATFWMLSFFLEPFEEVGTNSPQQNSFQTQFAKTNKEKVIPENQCEKHKKASLSLIPEEMPKKNLATLQQNMYVLCDQIRLKHM